MSLLVDVSRVVLKEYFEMSMQAGLPSSSRNTRVDVMLLRISTIYLVSGVFLGLLMVCEMVFLSSGHSPISLSGWVTMSITGLIYLAVPARGESKLAALHFWGHNLGLSGMRASFMLLRYGHPSAERILAGGARTLIASLARRIFGQRTSARSE